MASLAEHGTARLALSRLGPAGFAELARMHSDPRVMATLGGLRDDAWTRTTLANSAAHWDRHGFGYWLLFERASGRFAGRGGLRHVEIDGRDEVELGYALMAEFWGRGLATEFALECARVAFASLGLAEIVCFTTPDNRASLGVMRRAGFAFERQFTWAGGPSLLHRLRAPVAR